MVRLGRMGTQEAPKGGGSDFDTWPDERGGPRIRCIITSKFVPICTEIVHTRSSLGPDDWAHTIPVQIGTNIPADPLIGSGVDVGPPNSPGRGLWVAGAPQNKAGAPRRPLEACGRPPASHGRLVEVPGTFSGACRWLPRTGVIKPYEIIGCGSRRFGSKSRLCTLRQPSAGCHGSLRCLRVLLSLLLRGQHGC